jgi:hypothetical protein
MLQETLVVLLPMTEGWCENFLHTWLHAVDSNAFWEGKGAEEALQVMQDRVYQQSIRRSKHLRPLGMRDAI